MATRKFKQDQIVKYLMAGGDISTLSELGVSQRQLMAAFLSSPELVTSVRSKAKEEGQPFFQYDPSQEYDPATNINTVEAKYYAMPEKYGRFAKNFWNQVKAVGANPVEVGRIKEKIDSARDAYAAESGLTRDEFDELFSSLDKDVDDFQKAESQREKSQFKAFHERRKKMGITAKDPMQAESQFLEGRTGVRGLEAVPASLDDFVKQKSQAFVSKINPTWSSETKKRYQSQFESALKKQVGKNYTKFVTRDLLKKNLGLGE